MITFRARIIGIGLAVLTAATLGAVAPATADTAYGEFTVGGRIGEAFDATGGVGTWGNPITGERAAYQNGRFQVFEKNVSFYWKASIDNGRAHYVGGAIRGKWGALGFERKALGYPVTDELDVPGRGKRQDFQGGNLYWSSSGGAHPVWGGILGRWASQGGSRGFFGLPQSDEYRVGNRYAQDFQGGTLFWP
ncbi:LGFP repeat-containing protein [Williamsia deligens]|uniref:LGFP repeat-containing protein n=1 Tax=Williamsia deligens TaxID=321325 RepID=A0ABW3G858_9NOCA|nr:lysozyme [Williamsia deligens]MCP2192773.1 LGFP repeat-containing protein [Williamsia deligens]